MPDSKPTAQFSPRSQRSMLDEERLRGELANVDGMIRYTEKKKAEAEKYKAGLLQRAREGDADGRTTIHLSRTLEELEDMRRVLAAYAEQRAAVQAEVEALAPSPAKVAERTERQNYLVQLTVERRKKDELADAALKGLRRLLEERRELTAKIQKAAEVVKFTAGDDGLDARRFDTLLAALPEDLFPESARWAGWFHGNQEAKTYVVRDRLLVVPETLASHGVYLFGERIELSDKQARELMRENRLAATNVAPWRCAPPSIMTVEAWDAAAAAAKERGGTVEEVIFWEDFERDEKLRDGFNPLGAAGIDRYEDHGEPVTVHLKCLGNVSGDREYHAGEILEAKAGKWSLIESVHQGSFARP